MDGLRTFDGAVAIVTGAASGIGKAIAETLAARGSAVVLTDIDDADAEAAARQIRERGARASAHRLDVTNAREFEEVVSETVGRLGRLDYVFNNAGIGVAEEVGEHTLEAWDRILGVNLKGVIHGIQFAYPVMLRQGFGHIVNTASMAGLATLPGSGSYTATKHAVVALSRRCCAPRPGRERVLSRRDPHADTGEGPARHGIFLAGSGEAQRKFAREFFEQFRPRPPGRSRGRRSIGSRATRPSSSCQRGGGFSGGWSGPRRRYGRSWVARVPNVAVRVFSPTSGRLTRRRRRTRVDDPRLTPESRAHTTRSLRRAHSSVG